MDKYEKLKKIINDSKSIIFFTGAGISTPSNIPDFRSSNGLYASKFGHLSPEDIISHSFFIKNPKEFYQFYFSNMVYQNAKPNLAHTYIADLEKKGKKVWVITQNIDGLHQVAGTKNIIELHGSIYRNYCTKCHSFYKLEEILNEKNDVPICPKCGGIITPDVVLYEEQLNYTDIDCAISLISNAETMVIVGTSLVVYPAASFVQYFRGKHLILINKDATNYDDYCELVFNEDIIKVIKNIQ